MVKTGFDSRIGIIDHAATELHLCGLVDFASGGFITRGQHLTLTTRGLAFCLQNRFAIQNVVQRLGGDRHSVALSSAYGRLELELEIPDGLGNTLSRELLAPAVDRLVNFSDNQRQTEMAISLTEEAFQVIRGSNTLDEKYKIAILKQIEAGIALLKTPKTYSAILVAMLIKPLYDAYSSIAEEAAKPAISAAILAVRNLLGI